MHQSPWSARPADSRTDAPGPRSPGDPREEARRLLDAGGYAALTDIGVIRVEGADAVTFLQSQLTQDIAGQAVDRVTLTGYCNPKGRLLALFYCIRRSDHCLLLTERGLVESLVKRLRMYVLRAKVQVQDASDRNPVLGLTGTAVTLGSMPPPAPGTVLEQPDGLQLARPHGPAQWWVFNDPDTAARAWERLSAQAPAIDRHTWRLLDIRDGLPWIHSGNSEAFVPQQVNLDLVDGVSFRKGCYPGQEVVARMHYLGKPSRRMIRLLASIPVPEVPAAGTELLDSTGTVAGRVVSAAQGEQLELLAVVPVKAIASGERLHLGSVGLEPAPLPYPLD